jgi:xanthine dehydrogenase accessory factor
MREIINDIEKWHKQGKSIALATVIDANHSAPRGVGAKMVVSSEGEISGSVSAGCVEGAVVEQALEVLKTGQPVRLHYGIADEQAWDVGLTCGGNVDVYVERIFQPSTVDLVSGLLALVKQHKHFMTATVIDGLHAGRKITFLADDVLHGSTGNLDLDEEIASLAKPFFQEYRSALKILHVQTERIQVFFDVELPPERVMIIGATHIAIHLVHLAKQLGFKTIVIDPRAAFATPERFPHVDELYKGWPQDVIPGLLPDASSYLVVVSHDAKIDVPALDMGLKYPFRYIGLLGSKATQSDRQAGLRKLGYNDNEINKIYGPIGIRIGSRLPDEIALSILAEIIAVRRGKGKE